MYTEKQKLNNADKIALSPTSKTLAVYSEVDNSIKIYKLFNNHYELSRKIPAYDVREIAITDSLLLISHIFKNEAYLYTKKGNDWIKQSILRPRSEDCEFGYLVNISNDNNTAIVGACYNTNIDYDNDDIDKNYGSLYVFIQKDNTWIQQAELIATDKTASNYFGRSNAISSDGDTIIIGDWKSNIHTGSAYIFVRNDNVWIQQAKLLAPDGEDGDEFSRSVTISPNGNIAIVGVQGDDSCKGSAYVFVRNGNTWEQQAKLIAADRKHGDWFGYSVSISSNSKTVIVGAYGVDSGKGAAYVFVRNNNDWIQQAKLTASDATIKDLFGSTIVISSDENIIIVRANGHNKDRRLAYIFTRNND